MPKELFEAIGASNLKEVRRLINAGADVNEKNGENGETPLHMAARLYLVAFVEILLSYGADSTIKNEQGYTPYQAVHSAPLLHLHDSVYLQKKIVLLGLLKLEIVNVKPALGRFSLFPIPSPSPDPSLIPIPSPSPSPK